MSIDEVLAQTPLHARWYKCFGDEPQGFARFCPLNLIIGRNNSGKSALLDLVQFACSPFDITPDLHHQENIAQVITAVTLRKELLQSTFQPGSGGGPIDGNHWEYAKQFVGKRLLLELLPGNTKKRISFPQPEISLQKGERTLQLWGAVAANSTIPLEGKRFRRLFADRDIRPENMQEQPSIQANGTGFTNAIQRYLNNATLPSRIVEKELLGAVNAIFQPDATFINIRVQQHGNGPWEIYLEESEKGLIALSKSGSGIKTILLVISFFVLLPHMEKAPLSDFVFAFEELENNLHPALQRRLTSYLLKQATEKNCLIFLTTHSSAVIDMLSNTASAQILHVTHAGKTALVRSVKTYVDNRGILDDLDVRASDLLQSNGIVWVEGPTDRLYFNHWVKVFTEGALQEGLHYQCVFYGGRLLAHLSGAAPFDADLANEAIRILLVNRNAIVLMDSDRKDAAAPLNKTKTRVIEELTKIQGLPWVTAGREIENYLASSLHRIYPDIGTPLGQYEDIGHYLNEHKEDEGNKFEKNKMLFSEQIIPFISKAEIESSLDLKNMLTEVSNRIAQWNGLSQRWGAN